MMDTSDQSHHDNPLSTPLQETLQNINKAKDSSVEHVKNLKTYIETNSVEKLNKLLEDEHIQKKSLNTGLCIALQNCRANCEMLDIIEILLNHEAEPDCYFRYFNKASNPNPKIDDKDNVTILMYSCLQCNLELIDLILKYKPDINLKDRHQKNALFYAILSNKGDNVDVISLLCRKGIEINCVGKVEVGKNDTVTHSPLSLSATYNMTKTFEYLVQHGGNINFKTGPDEDSLLHIAVRNGNMDIIGIILDTPEALLEEKNREGKKPQDLALLYPQTDLYDIIGRKINEKKTIESENAKQLIDEEKKQIKKKKQAEQKLLEARIIQQQQQELAALQQQQQQELALQQQQQQQELAMQQQKELALQQQQYQAQLQQQYQMQSMKLANNTNNYQQQQKMMQYNQGNIPQIHGYNNNTPSYDNYYTIKENEDEGNEQPSHNHPLNYYNNNQKENIYENHHLNDNMLMMNYTNYPPNSNDINNDYSNQHPLVDPSFIQTPTPAPNKQITPKAKFSLIKLKKEHFHKANSHIMKRSPNVLEIPFNFSKTVHPQNKLNSYINLSTQPTLTIDLSDNAYELEMKYIAALNEKNRLYEKSLVEIAEQKKKIEALQNDYKTVKANLDNTEKEYLAKFNSLSIKFEVIKKENIELQSAVAHHKDISSQNSIIDLKHNHHITPSNQAFYLNKKFIHFDYDEKYINNCLSKDLKDYQQFVANHIESEQKNYDQVLKNIETAVKESIPNFEVRLYGSHATSLCLSWSDLDIVLIPKKPEYSNFNTNHLLSNLCENLRLKPWCSDLKYIPNATIPLIKIVSSEAYHHIPIDISIQDDKHFGLKCVDLVKNFIQQYESLKPLVLALKNILKSANLNDPYKGGLSSYGLILMIVSFLQMRKLQNKDISANNGNLGLLLYEFIKYHGLIFKSDTQVVYPKIDEDYDEEMQFQPRLHNEHLVIVDPLNPMNNVAKSCFQYLNMKMTFIICFIAVQEDCECECHYCGAGEEYSYLNFDHCFLKRMFSTVKRYQIME